MAPPPTSVLPATATLLLVLLLPPEAPACQFYCYSFPRGAFCCQTSEADPYAKQAVQQRAGLCPPARRRPEEASVPYECFKDHQCPYHRDKCCYDAILEHKVCKSPIYSGVSDYLSAQQQQRRRQTTGKVTNTEHLNPANRPTTETTKTTTTTTTTATKRPVHSSTTNFATWGKSKSVYAPMFPHSKPQPQRGLYPFHPIYSPNAHRSFVGLYGASNSWP